MPSPALLIIFPMTRRSAFFCLAGTLASGFLSRLSSAVPSQDLTGWTLFDLCGTFLETRLIFQDGRWVEIFPWMRRGETTFANPEWESATHECYAAIDPAGKHFVIIHERGIPLQGCEIKRPGRRSFVV